MKTDWIAEVFAAIRDSGEDISIVYGHKSEAAGPAEPQWFELPHNEFDGISGMANVLGKRGFRVEQLPVLRDDRFTIMRALRGLIAVLPVLRIRQRQWRSFDGTRQVRFVPVRQRLAWQLLTEQQTDAVVRAAKATGVTVNTFLMFHLDAVVAKQLAEPSSNRRWMVPVNLRGAVTRYAENPPHMSFLAIDCEGRASLGQLQAQITGQKARAMHWGSWITLHLGKLIGAKAMRWDVRNRESKNHGWTGIFSNLGVWKVPESGGWIFCPAIWRAQPIGAGCVTMNGRMALSIQLHDGFDGASQAAQKLLAAWTRACLPSTALQQTNTRRHAMTAVG